MVATAAVVVVTGDDPRDPAGPADALRGAHGTGTLARLPVAHAAVLGGTS
jgi:hypothetical protein